MDALNTTMMVDQPDGPEQRRSKIVPAARWVSIDYRSIVANAVAGLANNTPDARRDVYAQARGVVHRHLQLMRLPEPIVELEKLALDLTIRKVERQARAAQAVPEEEEEPAEEATVPTVGDAVHSFGSALGKLAQAFTSLMIVLGLRPVFYALWIISPLRFIGRAAFSAVGLAAGLPIAALLGITIYLLDTDTTFQSAVTARATQFREHVDAWLNEPSPALAGKDEERVAGRIEPPPPVGTAPARAVPARARVTASSRSHNGAYDPPFEANVVGAGARAAAPKAAPSFAASNPKSLPKWFAAYSSVSEAAPTSSAALESGPRGATGRLSISAIRIGRRQFNDSYSERSAAEATLADDIASAAPRALAEGRRADRDRQEGGNRR